MKMPKSEDGLHKLQDDLWDKILNEEYAKIPIPDELSEDEEQSLLLMRLSVKPGEKVTEDEMIELMARAAKAKWDWYLFRGAMAGILNLKIKDGQLMLSLTKRFRKENPHLKEALQRMRERES